MCWVTKTKQPATTKSAAKKPAAKKSLGKKSASSKTKSSAKKSAVRTTAKVSPLKGMPVNAWVKAKTRGWHSEFELGGPIAWVKPAKAHVSFGFWRGAEFTDRAGVLEGGSGMRHVKISSPAQLDVGVITALLIEAARLNAKLGDPTKRHAS